MAIDYDRLVELLRVDLNTARVDAERAADNDPRTHERKCAVAETLAILIEAIRDAEISNDD